jgi:hypothetical protein
VECALNGGARNATATGRRHYHREVMKHAKSAVDVDLLRRAHRLFEDEEPRNLFYRAAIFLIDRALQPSPTLTLAESLAVLLQTWNAQFYRFHGKFTNQRLSALEDLLARYMDSLMKFRRQRLGDAAVDEGEVTRLFTEFEAELGPVGAAKTLHLLAPCYFPLWDRAIAQTTYRLNLSTPAAGSYIKLMRLVKDEIDASGGWPAFKEGENAVKLIDELHYCTATLGLQIPA